MPKPKKYIPKYIYCPYCGKKGEVQRIDKDGDYMKCKNCKHESTSYIDKEEHYEPETTRENQKITINITQEELEDMSNGEEFNWNFPTEKAEWIDVRLYTEQLED